METATFLVKICSSPFFNSEAAHWASLISQTSSSITFNHNNNILCSEMLVNNYNLTPQSVNNNVLHSSFLSKIDLEQNKENQIENLTLGGGLISLSSTAHTVCIVYVHVIPIDPFESSTRWTFLKPVKHAKIKGEAGNARMNAAFSL